MILLCGMVHDYNSFTPLLSTDSLLVFTLGKRHEVTFLPIFVSQMAKVRPEMMKLLRKRDEHIKGMSSKSNLSV